MEPHPTNFGARLRGLIDRKGQTLAEFAAAFGVSESHLHNWLKLTAPPLEKHWAPLAKYFGCSTNYIAFGTPEKSEPLYRSIADTHRIKFAVEESSNERALQLRDELDRMWSDLITAAGDDIGHLGWIRTQVGEHLKIPSSWNAHDIHAQIERHPLKDVPLFPPDELASPEEHAQLYGPPKSTKPKAQASK